MCPLVTGRNRVSRLKKVVLPAPFGPISAWMVPRLTSRLTFCTATKPAKLLVSASVRRNESASLMGLLFAGGSGGRTAALVDRPECLVPRDRGDQLDQVGWPLRLRRLLDLNQIDVMHHAAIGTQLTVGGERVVDLMPLHPGEDFLRIVRFSGLYRQQIGPDRGIEPGHEIRRQRLLPL